MISKVLITINTLDMILAKGEKLKREKIKTNAIIHCINNQTKIILRELQSINLQLDAYSKINQNKFEEEIFKIINKNNLSAQISRIITHLIITKNFDAAKEIARTKNLLLQTNTYLLS